MESLVTSPANPSPNGIATSNFPTIDPTLVVEHLAAILEITLGATRKDLENAGSLLSKAKYSETVQRCTRFATENQLALYVQKDIASLDASDGSLDGAGICQHPFQLTCAYVGIKLRYHTSIILLQKYLSPPQQQLLLLF